VKDGEKTNKCTLKMVEPSFVVTMREKESITPAGKSASKALKTANECALRGKTIVASAEVWKRRACTENGMVKPRTYEEEGKLKKENL
jgi:hypothetical protein